ncbi:MAG: DNA polymerase III subunit alpha, partial [Clostridia bacterium]|nr:DNA polymerase III subunit alpha [Clostridia bacterium]
TDIDPIRYDLIFESFLNIDRVSMPDFDIDFADTRREEVIDYVKRKYNESHVSQIITFGTMSARAVVRDVGRALGMPNATVDSVAKMIPRELHIKLTDALKERELAQRYESSPEIKRLIDIALVLEGMPRNASTHAAGVVITDRPVYEYVPLSANGGNTLTQFGMDTIADLGLLKFDFLGIRFLSVIAECEETIRKTDPTFRVEDIGLDDPETFELLRRGNTEGTFQLSKPGFRAMLVQMRPESFNDIIAAIALYRPGPLRAGAADAYAINKRDRSKIKYPTEKLAPILDSTYGCLLYTEQITQIFRELAGYPFGRADNVRRAIKKKKADVIENEKESFIHGAAEHGISREVAEGIFSDIKGFSEYAFNKSHATAYAVTSYRTAYLKTHYFKEYYSALISSDMSSHDVYDYISELKKSGIRVLAPDVNSSGRGFSVEQDAIRFGLLAIANVGRPLVDLIVSEREKNGKYASFDDFAERTASSDLTRRQYEMLVKAGALDSFGINRSALLAMSEDVMSYRSSRASRDPGQLDLISAFEFEGDAGSRRFTIPDIPEMPEINKLKFEKESLGIYLSGSLIERYSRHIKKLGALSVAALAGMGERTFRDGERVTVAGIIERINNKKTKKGDAMSFVTIDDPTGEIDVVVFSELLARVGHLLITHRAIAVSGTVSIRDDAASVIASSVTPLVEDEKFSDETPRTIYVRIDRIGSPLYGKIHAELERSKGECPVVYYCTDDSKYIKESGLSVSDDESSLERLRSAAGRDNVVVK